MAPDRGRHRIPGRLGKLFADLKVRPKLMVLHNIFFVVLASAVYFALIPPFEEQVGRAEAREAALVTGLFLEGSPILRGPGMEIYGYREGTAAALGVPVEARDWLDAHPGTVFRSPADPDRIYLRGARPAEYRTLLLPHAFYARAVHRARWTLIVVLGLVYLAAVLLLEIFIMPLYVYRPLRLLLEADSATQRGDLDNELIDPRLIPGDELGQIMRSRNETVSQLRRHEADLAAALAELERAASDLRRKNRLLETAKRNLAEQDRLASLGLLSASVAHELNTPLAVLHGSIEKLMETVADQASLDRLGRMLRVTQRLRRISESLLDFARSRGQEMTAVAVRPVIDEAWALVGIDEKANSVSFSNRVSHNDVVMGDADRLVQVFVNLLRNSLSAIRFDGSIGVSSRKIFIEDLPWIAVTVEDDGPGIPAEVLPQIFEAFVSTRLDARGTGLGLAVAEGIVQQHGGRIHAANRPEGGACLEVRLPAAAAVRRSEGESS
jgi:signal transduction histidine kinase